MTASVNKLFLLLLLTFLKVKHVICSQDLWEEAHKFPLHWLLYDASDYTFSCINAMAEAEELVDEGKRLCDVKPFVGVLKLVERRGEKAEKQFNVQISHLIGRSMFAP